MDLPYAYRLQRPPYSYSEEGTKTDPDKLRGLLRYGPLRLAPVRQPKCLFIFLDGDRGHANKLYLSLRNGVSRFPGCKQLTGIILERDQVEALRIPSVNPANQARAFADEIENYMNGKTEKPDFAFVLHSNQPTVQVEDPYGAAKAALTKHAIPSQYIGWELLDSPNQFQFAISNIALSFFVKLGGVPWSVAFERKAPTLVFGVGSVQVEDKKSKTRVRLIGFATCVLSNGVYLDTSFFPPAETHEQYLENLNTGLREALDRMLNKIKVGLGKVTIHVSQVERRDTIQLIQNIINEYERDQQLPIPFELVRLTADSDFSVLDLSHSGYVSEEGTVVALDQEHALLVTEGRREQGVWRGRKPVTLELRRQYRSSPSLQFKETILDAFYLSSVNWRGFNAVTQPISLQYARLLARQVAKMSHADNSIIAAIQQNNTLNAIPWYI
jgi:hypothetical protein